MFSFPFQLTRVLRNFNITKISDLELISNTTDRLDITFHFFGIKGDSQRIRDVITRMVERGRIGNFTLVSNYHHFDENPPLNMLVSKNCRNTFIWLIRTVAGLTNEWQPLICLSNNKFFKLVSFNSPLFISSHGKQLICNYKKRSWHSSIRHILKIYNARSMCRVTINRSTLLLISALGLLLYPVLKIP